MQITVIHTAVLLAAVIAAAALLALRPRRGRASRRRHARNIRKASGILDMFSREGFAPGQAIAYLRKVSPYVFEEVILSAFERKGCGVERNRRYSGDGGCDGRIRSGKETLLLQCKRYRGHVSRRHVAEFAELCAAQGRRGVFLHTGRTGKGSLDAVRTGAGRVDIVSGRRLACLVLPGKEGEFTLFNHKKSHQR